MKKIFTGAFCVLAAVLCPAQEGNSGPIFAADFDSFSPRASFAAGDAAAGGLKTGLEERKFPGVAGKGNAVCLKAAERITWSAHKNFDPRHGTVSFWIAPQEWNYEKKGLTTFFETRFGEYYFAVYEENKYGTFSFVICTFKPKYREIGQVRFRMPAKEWKMGVWHKIDAVWDENMMALYFDGALAKTFSKNPCRFSAPVRFPGTAPGRWMQLGWGTRLAVQDTTAFDDLKIYDRVLSADEIKREYEKVFPAKTPADGK